MTIKQKQWQLYYLGYYGGRIDGLAGQETKDATARRLSAVSDPVEST